MKPIKVFPEMTPSDRWHLTETFRSMLMGVPVSYLRVAYNEWHPADVLRCIHKAVISFTPSVTKEGYVVEVAEKIYDERDLALAFVVLEEGNDHLIPLQVATHIAKSRGEIWEEVRP